MILSTFCFLFVRDFVLLVVFVEIDLCFVLLVSIFFVFLFYTQLAFIGLSCVVCVFFVARV